MNWLRWTWIKSGLVSLVMVAIISGSVIDVVQAREPAYQDIGHVVSFQTEVIFPAAVRFSVTVDVALGDVEEATLTIYQSREILPPITLNLEEQTGLSTPELTQLVHMWPLESADPLTPFAPLSFRWEVVTSDGITSMVDGDLRLEDAAHGQWQVAGPPPVVVYWVDAQLAGKALREDLLPVHGLLELHTGQSLEFRIVGYEQNVPLCQELRDAVTGEVRSVVVSLQDSSEFPCSVEAYEDVYAEAGMMFMERPLGYIPFQDAIIQRMVAEAYDPFWRDTFVPEWFKAGLGFIYRQYGGQTMLVLAQSAERQNNLFTIPELSIKLPDDASHQDRALWEAQSYLLVLYLIDQFGADQIFNLARTAGGGDFESALFSLIGGDERVLWDEWYRWLLFVDSATTATWTPYLVPNP